MNTALAIGISPQLKAHLCSPLPVDQHYFFNNLVYLKEQGVKDHITLGTLNWSWIANDPDRNDARDRAATVTGHLTVHGITRSGVGMDNTKISKDDAEKEVNEPEKSAATDAFKRAARMHWVGDYLLGAPKGMSTHKALEEWLQARAEEEKKDWTSKKFVILCLRDYGLVMEEIAPALEQCGEPQWKKLSYREKYALLGNLFRVSPIISIAKMQPA